MVRRIASALAAAGAAVFGIIPEQVLQEVKSSHQTPSLRRQLREQELRQRWHRWFFSVYEPEMTTEM